MNLLKQGICFENCPPLRKILDIPHNKTAHFTFGHPGRKKIHSFQKMNSAVYLKYSLSTDHKTMECGSLSARGLFDLVFNPTVFSRKLELVINLRIVL